MEFLFFSFTAFTGVQNYSFFYDRRAAVRFFCVLLLPVKNKGGQALAASLFSTFSNKVETCYSLNCGGRLLRLDAPRVMGILNLTPDSFFSESRQQTEEAVAARCRQMLAEGADIIDAGAYSSRPGAADVSMAEEMARLRSGLAVLRQIAPQAIVSVDTFRADVARMCVEEYGVDMVNDISAGALDKKLFRTVAD